LTEKQEAFNFNQLAHISTTKILSFTCFRAHFMLYFV